VIALLYSCVALLEDKFIAYHSDRFAASAPHPCPRALITEPKLIELFCPESFKSLGICTLRIAGACHCDIRGGPVFDSQPPGLA